MFPNFRSRNKVTLIGKPMNVYFCTQSKNHTSGSSGSGCFLVVYLFPNTLISPIYPSLPRLHNHVQYEAMMQYFTWDAAPHACLQLYTFLRKWAVFEKLSYFSPILAT